MQPCIKKSVYSKLWKNTNSAFCCWQQNVTISNNNKKANLNKKNKTNKKQDPQPQIQEDFSSVPIDPVPSIIAVTVDRALEFPLRHLWVPYAEKDKNYEENYEGEV